MTVGMQNREAGKKCDEKYEANTSRSTDLSAEIRLHAEEGAMICAAVVRPITAMQLRSQLRVCRRSGYTLTSQTSSSLTAK
jgi:hypothetical protein